MPLTRLLEGSDMNIGERVRVVTKMPESYLFAKEPFRLSTYEGTIVRGNERLDPPGTFNLLTGNPQYPVSIIAMKNVVEWEVIGKVKGAPFANRSRYILVRTAKGTEHKVALFSSGHATCDCTGFGYRRNCSHVSDGLAYVKRRFGNDWVKGVFK